MTSYSHLRLFCAQNRILHTERFKHKHHSRSFFKKSFMNDLYMFCQGERDNGDSFSVTVVHWYCLWFVDCSLLWTVEVIPVVGNTLRGSLFCCCYLSFQSWPPSKPSLRVVTSWAHILVSARFDKRSHILNVSPQAHTFFAWKTLLHIRVIGSSISKVGLRVMHITYNCPGERVNFSLPLFSRVSRTFTCPHTVLRGDNKVSQAIFSVSELLNGWPSLSGVWFIPLRASIYGEMRTFFTL